MPATGYYRNMENLNPTHPALPPAHVGILLVNLGTPEATDYWSIRRYLAEFLHDKRVIELSRWLWCPILHGPILTFRPPKVGRAYASIWNNELNESPLKTITRLQAQKLQQQVGENVHVAWAMRYGKPAIAPTLDAMHKAGCSKILVCPLYPQYAAPTTASVVDEVNRTLRHMRWQPTLRFLPPYYDNAHYIKALAQHMQEELNALSFVPDVILASFHGMPKSYCEKGDPYYCHCHKTLRLLKEALPEDIAHTLKLTFQSRFGPTAWLQPYTDKTIKELAQQGVKNLAVITPGFAADCLETLEEIAVEGKASFIENGGENYAAIPCLNDTKEGITMLKALCQNELKGWINS